MPTSEKMTETGGLAEAEKLPDFAELQKQKEALFKEIEADSLQLDENAKFLIVSRILGHSVKDGFEMARKLGCDLLLPLASEDFLGKHKTFASAFSKFMDDTESYISIDSNAKRYRVGVLRARLDGNVEPLRIDTRPNTPHLSEIENYYAHFIKNRRLESPDLPKDDRTQAEKMAEEHLISTEAVLKESYYTRPVRKLLKADTEEGLEQLRRTLGYYYVSEIADEIIGKLRGDVITRYDIDSIFEFSGLSWDSPEVKKALRDARYAPSKVVFETRKKASEELLIKQIKDSLAKKGWLEGKDFEITFDKDKSQYEIVDKRPQGGEIGKEQFVEISDGVPIEIPEVSPKEEAEFLAMMENSLDRKVQFSSTLSHKVGGKMVGVGTITDTSLLPKSSPKSGKALRVIFFGDEHIFGPYDKLQICRNSKEELIFYARKSSDGRTYVYSNGVAVMDVTGLIPDDSLVTEVVKVKNLVYLHCQKPDGEPQIYRVGYQTFSKEAIPPKIRSFQEVKDEIFYIEDGPDRGAGNVVTWGRTQVLHKFESKLNAVKSLGNRIFITDHNKLLIMEYGTEELEEIDFGSAIYISLRGNRLFVVGEVGQRVWEYTDKLELEERERRDLDLANAVAAEDLKPIDEYFTKYYPEESAKTPMERMKDSIKEGVEQSKSFVRTVNQTIKEAPKLFLDTLRAKNDKPTEALMTEMFFYMFPEAKAKYEKFRRSQAEAYRNRPTSSVVRVAKGEAKSTTMTRGTTGSHP